MRFCLVTTVVVRWLCVRVCPSQRDFLISLRSVSAALSEPWSEDSEADVDDRVQQGMVTAAATLHAIITMNVAPSDYWPSLFGAAHTAGLWAMRPSPFTVQQAQELVLAFEVRLVSRRMCSCGIARTRRASLSSFLSWLPLRSFLNCQCASVCMNLTL